MRHRTDNTAATPRLVVVLAFERAQLLDVAGPVQTFASANEIANKITKGAHGAPYRVVVVSRRGGPVTTTSGLPLVTRPLARTLGKARIDTLIIPGGGGVQNAVKEAATVEWVRRQAASVRRIASVCTGAFLLAEAGVLAGRRATTHWQFCARLAQQYPDIQVDADPIYVRDGRIWTSAGITAGIDLSLALVQEDLGRKVAMAVARHLVVFLNRPGRPVAVFRAARSAGRGRRRQCAQSFRPTARLDRRECRRRFARRAARRTGRHEPAQLRANLCGEDGRHAGAHGGADPRRGGSPQSRRKRSADQTDRGAVRFWPRGAITPRLRATSRHHAGGIPAAVLGHRGQLSIAGSSISIF